MIGSAAIEKAIVALWSSSGLDTLLKSYWVAADRSKFLSLIADMGEGDHPFPYCIIEIAKPFQSAQSSDGNESLRTLWNVPLTLRVHTKKITTGAAARAVAAILMDEIAKVYGGHPAVKNQIAGTQLDYGHILGSQFLGDFAIREDLENVAWQLQYNLQTDVPAVQ